MGSSLKDWPSFLYISGPVKTAFDHPFSRILSYKKPRVHIKWNFPFRHVPKLCVYVGLSCSSVWVWVCLTIAVSLSLTQTLRDRGWDTNRDTQQQLHPLTDTQTRKRVKGLKFSSHNLRSVSLGTGQNSWGAHFFIRSPKFRPTLAQCS